MPDPAGSAETIARDETPRGTVVLRRRADGSTREPVYELLVNGTFVMDTADSSTERRLARAFLERLDTGAGPVTVAVGGLGLGFTAAELLGDERVGLIDVVELEPAVIDWVRAGLVPATAQVLHDARVHVHNRDIRHWLAERPIASADAVLLDVDNGPDYLVHRANTLVYEASCLRDVARVLRPGGMLAIWSASRSKQLVRRLRTAFGECTEIVLPGRRPGHTLEYVCYVASDPLIPAS